MNTETGQRTLPGVRYYLVLLSLFGWAGLAYLFFSHPTGTAVFLSRHFWSRPIYQFQNIGKNLLPETREEAEQKELKRKIKKELGARTTLDKEINEDVNSFLQSKSIKRIEASVILSGMCVSVLVFTLLIFMWVPPFLLVDRWRYWWQRQRMDVKKPRGQRWLENRRRKDQKIKED